MKVSDWKNEPQSTSDKEREKMESTCEQIQRKLEKTKLEYMITLKKDEGCVTMLHSSGQSGLIIVYNQIRALCDSDADLMYDFTMCLQKMIREQEAAGKLKGRREGGKVYGGIQ